MIAKQQMTAIKVLMKFNLIEKIKHGLPAKRYFYLNMDAFYDLLTTKKVCFYGI